MVTGSILSGLLKRLQPRLPGSFHAITGPVWNNCDSEFVHCPTDHVVASVTAALPEIKNPRERGVARMLAVGTDILICFYGVIRFKIHWLELTAQHGRTNILNPAAKEWEEGKNVFHSKFSQEPAILVEARVRESRTITGARISVRNGMTGKQDNDRSVSSRKFPVGCNEKSCSIYFPTRIFRIFCKGRTATVHNSTIQTNRVLFPPFLCASLLGNNRGTKLKIIYDCSAEVSLYFQSTFRKTLRASWV